MKSREQSTPAFLSGGGEMGELIRSFDWSETSIGRPDKWPQSLCIALRIMLDSPFGMYIAWGKDYIQLYNDGYRPILGATKHPQALGNSSRETFAEIWPTIGPMFEGVMQGKPVGFTDFTLELDRNGFLEECVFDFSYSPIRLEHGEVGGVLVTVIETTEKVKNLKKLTESIDQLNFAIEATELGTWDYNPITNKFTGNNRLKDWFGLPHEAQILLSRAIDVMFEEDKNRVAEAIQKALQYESGGLYDIEYGIINPVTKQERIVRAKGRAWFGDDKLAYRFNGTLQDITEQNMIRKKLEESEQYITKERTVLYNSFMNAPAAIAILKGDTFIYEFANAEYEKVVDRKITIGKTVQELFPEIEKQGLIDLLNNVFTTGEPFIANEFPVELLDSKTGKPVLHYYNSVMQPLKDENGNTERLLSHGIEVTQQIEARKKIEESEQRFGAAIEAVEGIVWTNNANGEMEGEQPGWSALTGQTYEEYRGYGWASAVHPEDAEPTVDAWNNAVREFKTFVFEHRLKTISGNWELFSIKAIPLLNEDGTIREWIGVHTNITEQRNAQEKIKESQKQFQILAESLPQLAWIADGHGWINWYNKRWYDYTGTTFEEMEGWGWSKVHHPDHIKEVTEFVKVAWKKDEAFELTFPLRRHDGVFRWFLTRAYPVKDNNGNIERWIGTNTDITEQKSFAEELEAKVKERTEELNEKNIQLELTNAELASFSYVASHDLKEPLRKIQVFSKRILETENFTDKTKDYFNRIISAGERMQNLIDSLLDLSSSTSTDLIFKTCDLNAIVEESKHDLQERINEKSATIESEHLPVINGVYIQLSQLFTNLIDNAIKYSRSGTPPHITITASIIAGSKIEHPSADHQKEYHAIKIADNGIGFEKEYAHKIFELFQRLHLKNEYSGTGIGLAIVKKIVTNHHGFIIAEGKPNIGSTFTIYLPTT